MGIVTTKQYLELRSDTGSVLAGPFTTQADAVAAAQQLCQTYAGDITACLITVKPLKILQRAVSVTSTDVP